MTSPSTPPSAAPDWQAHWQDELQPEHLLSSLLAGLVTGVIGVIRGISYAALIFAGDLADFLNVGVGLAIYSTAAISVVVALSSSLPGMIATPLAAPTAVLAVLAAAIAAQMSQAPTFAMVNTVVAAIGLGSLLTGVFLWLLGRLQGGKAVSFVPYPVVGGFMAGTGLLLVRGGVQVMCELPLDWETIPLLLQPTQALHWGVGLILGLLLLGVSKRWQQYWVLPSSIFGAIALFYGGLWASHTSTATARTAGWLLGPFPQGGLWRPLSLDQWHSVDWGIILGQSGTLATLVFISLLSLVLTNNGIELAVEREIDLNQELKAVGLANLAAGVGCGMAGNQALPSTLLVHKMGAKHRLSGVFKLIPCSAVLLLGSGFLAFFPKPILGSLLLYLGIDLLVQWLYKSFPKLPLTDYLTIVLIMVVINAVGFLEGVVVGLIMSVVLFLVNYSRIHTTRAEFSGSHQPSNKVRSPHEQVFLSQQGGAIHILQLHGFIFFGRANHLLTAVKERIAEPEQPTLQYLVLDCHLVSGLDSSAVLNFTKIRKLLRQQQVTLIWVGLSPVVKALLAQGEALGDTTVDCYCSPTLETALQWCEDRLLADHGQTLPEPATLDAEPLASPLK
ncbi:MAG: SulP family inorganic anion transporter [Spirulina sp. SIO3F2]|nr:SulP family inorganic anion transporter [Spirulina sp. SIO3F2]